MIMVFGSIHMTVTVDVPRLPRPGEVLNGANRHFRSGGRGAELAMAVRRFGVPTQLVGAVGDDDFGDAALDRLRMAGVDIGRVRHLSGQATGLACVTVSAGSPSTEVVAPGANAALRAHWVSDDELAACRSLLTHGEVPVAQSLALASRARHAGCRTVLQVSPWAHGGQPPRGIFDWIVIDVPSLRRACAELHIANEAVDAADALSRLASTLRARALLYRGEDGAIVADPQGSCRRRAGFAPPVAGTGAAFEVFTGVFAAALNQGLGEAAAVDHAIAAAGLVHAAAAEPGAPGIPPSRSAIEDALLRHDRPQRAAAVRESAPG